MKTRLHTSIREDAHSYTRSTCPWIMENHTSVYGRLIDYLSGGGMRAFGRTIRQEETRRRQRRFLAFATFFAALWVLFLFF